ncbi:MAG: hypothetical protein WBD31_28770 [Rubripirellula sp.]
MNAKPTRILLIEDEAGDAMLVRHSLKRSVGNYEVTHSTTLSDGLSEFAREPSKSSSLTLGFPIRWDYLRSLS